MHKSCLLVASLSKYECDFPSRGSRVRISSPAPSKFKPSQVFAKAFLVFLESCGPFCGPFDLKVRRNTE